MSSHIGNKNTTTRRKRQTALGALLDWNIGYFPLMRVEKSKALLKIDDTLKAKKKLNKNEGSTNN